MANQPYYPSREGDQLNWFTNVQTKIPGYYIALDVSTARQARLTLALNWLIWTWGPTCRPAARTDPPWWDSDTPTKQWGPVLRATVQG